VDLPVYLLQVGSTLRVLTMWCVRVSARR
jgi:hypothetical protein